MVGCGSDGNMEKMIGIKVFEGLRSEGDEFAYISDWIIEEPPPGASTKERYQNQSSDHAPSYKVS